MRAGITLLLVLTALATLLSVAIKPTYAEDQIKTQCLEYERDGYIPSNSCACTEILFPSWSVSYNWMDACEILEARGK